MPDTFIDIAHTLYDLVMKETDLRLANKSAKLAFIFIYNSCYDVLNYMCIIVLTNIAAALKFSNCIH